MVIAAAALRTPDWKATLAQGDPSAPHLVFDWSPGGTVDHLAGVAAELEAEISGPVERVLCPHPAGPPTCWCRPPLPGLPLAFARTHGLDPARSLLIGTSPAHRTLATTLGARFVTVWSCAGETIGTVERGDVVGEVAVLAYGRRSATVVATTPMRLISIFKPDVWALERQAPQAGGRLRELLDDRTHPASSVAAAEE